MWSSKQNITRVKKPKSAQKPYSKSITLAKHTRKYKKAVKYFEKIERKALLAKAKMVENAAARRCAELKATPGWSDRAKIRQIYLKAKNISEETKLLHHVDHIIPLRGKLVSGLHVPENLQIIPWQENLKKGNKFVAMV